MKKTSNVTILLLVLSLGYLAGRWHKAQPTSTSAAGDRRILYYHDPMHPAYKSDRPGIAPDCGMQLEAVYADGDLGDSGANSHVSLGTIQVSPERQQTVGIQTWPVRRTIQRASIRILGRVAADETRLYPVKAAVDGWIKSVYPNSVGSFVKKGQPLASFYAPEFLRAEQDYVFALNTLNWAKPSIPQSPAQFQLPDTKMQLTLDTLHALGMDDRQIKELEITRKFSENIVIYAPEMGFVEVRNVAPGLRFQKGAELYRIVDLRRVWILADILGSDAAHLKPGMEMQVVSRQLTRSFAARMSDVLPTIAPLADTLTVRFEADNPDFILKPDMLVDMDYPMELPLSLNVPADAVLDTGRSKSVFVALGNGYFERRNVETGWRHGNHVEITRGLKIGEEIVISGNFLLDSESRMKAAAAGFHGAIVKDPVCGMDLDEDKAKATGRKLDYRDVTYFFCSDACKRKFAGRPEGYAQPAPADDDQTRPARMAQDNSTDGGPQTESPPGRSAVDPVCGMGVDPAHASGRSEYQGSTFYFCSDRCKKNFDEDPQPFLVRRTAVGDFRIRPAE